MLSLFYNLYKYLQLSLICPPFHKQAFRTQSKTGVNIGKNGTGSVIRDTVRSITLKIIMAGSATTPQLILYNIFALSVLFRRQGSVSRTTRVLPLERHISVNQTTEHTYVQTDKIHPRKDVIASNHHT